MCVVRVFGSQRSTLAVVHQETHTSCFQAESLIGFQLANQAGRQARDPLGSSLLSLNSTHYHPAFFLECALGIKLRLPCLHSQYFTD